MIDGDRVQNTPWITTPKEEDNRILFWRNVFCKAYRWCVSDWIEECFVLPESRMRHGEETGEYWWACGTLMETLKGSKTPWDNILRMKSSWSLLDEERCRRKQEFMRAEGRCFHGIEHWYMYSEARTQDRYGPLRSIGPFRGFYHHFVLWVRSHYCIDLHSQKKYKSPAWVWLLMLCANPPIITLCRCCRIGEWTYSSGVLKWWQMKPDI